VPDYGRASLMQAYVAMMVVMGFGLFQGRKKPIFRLPLEEKGEET
tara:strand:+ start:1252 stop:1386 length:135 start_codon:yes stop_codon:yes gene_type:complete